MNLILEKLILHTTETISDYNEKQNKKTKIGSLVIKLPLFYSGGNLVLSNQSKSFVQNYDFNNNDETSYSCHYVAFLSDLDFTFEKLSKGFRILIQYSIETEANVEAITSESNLLNAISNDVLNYFKEPKHKSISIFMEHEYKTENIRRNGVIELKGYIFFPEIKLY